MVWAGLVGLVIAGVCTALAFAARRRVRAMVGTETLPVRELRALHEAAVAAAGPGQFRYRCEVVGVAQPDGVPLVSQLKRLECVWHRHKVTHKYWETRTDGNGNRKREQRSRVVSQHVSETAFLVDDGTGSVSVRPAKQGVDAADKILDHFERDTGDRGGRLTIGGLSLSLPASDGSIGYQQEEWALAPGRRLYVHGEASDAQGSLVIGPPAEGGVFIISTRSQEELVRSERAKLRGFGIGGAVAGGAGVVLLLVAAVSAALG